MHIKKVDESHGELLYVINKNRINRKIKLQFKRMKS